MSDEKITRLVKDVFNCARGRELLFLMKERFGKVTEVGYPPNTLDDVISNLSHRRFREGQMDVIEQLEKELRRKL